jgi:hypothetical protein
VAGDRLLKAIRACAQGSPELVQGTLPPVSLRPTDEPDDVDPADPLCHLMTGQVGPVSVTGFVGWPHRHSQPSGRKTVRKWELRESPHGSY